MTYPLSQNQIEMLAEMVKRENERAIREFEADPYSFYVSDYILYEPSAKGDCDGRKTRTAKT